MGYADTYMPLYEPVRYRAEDGSWHTEFFEAVERSTGDLTWDPATILSMLSFSHPCGDRTLLSEVTRQPWMSIIGPDGEPQLQPIAPHDTLFKSHDQIAADFARLVQEELVEACKGRKKVYLTLSGGMDSRISAAIICRAAEAGEIDAEIVAVTWGWALPNSADAVYGKKTAEILGIKWIFVDYKPEDLLRNVELSASRLAGLVPGIHMHRMSWFDNVPKEENAVVMATSYGDLIGRAEFGDKLLLELRNLEPADKYGLLNPRVLPRAYQLLRADILDLNDRAPGQPEYVHAEHGMYAHYARGWCAQAMGIVNRTCTAHQVLTSPRVYSYVWSIHPSLRTDHVYARVLENVNPRLLRLPWSRTNRAFMGKTEGAERGIPHLNPRLCYRWIDGVLYDRLLEDLDLDWFRDNEIFHTENVKRLCERVRTGPVDYDSWDIFIWLVTLRRLARLLEEKGKTVEAKQPDPGGEAIELPPRARPNPPSKAYLWFRNTALFRIAKPWRDKIHQYRLRRRALKEYPFKKAE